MRLAIAAQHFTLHQCQYADSPDWIVQLPRPARPSAAAPHRSRHEGIQIGAAAYRAVDHILQHDDETWAPLLGRVVVGIAGVPGSGKTTVAAQVVARIQKRLGTTSEDNPAVAISMDGDLPFICHRP